MTWQRNVDTITVLPTNPPLSSFRFRFGSGLIRFVSIRLATQRNVDTITVLPTHRCHHSGFDSVPV
jgi:hypothetical protein